MISDDGGQQLFIAAMSPTKRTVPPIYIYQHHSGDPPSCWQQQHCSTFSDTTDDEFGAAPWTTTNISLLSLFYDTTQLSRGALSSNTSAYAE
jgi:hypothetical protein